MSAWDDPGITQLHPGKPNKNTATPPCIRNNAQVLTFAAILSCSSDILIGPRGMTTFLQS
jgi:hypothetical protein